MPTRGRWGDDPYEDVNEGRYSIRAVTRAIDLLNALGDQPGSRGLSELARQTGLPTSTAFRYLEVLRVRGLIHRSSDGNYELGARLFELGSTFVRGVSLWDQAAGLARDLAAHANETASVGILDDGRILYIAIANGQHKLGIQSNPGTRHPVHCTALGKAILASMPWMAVERLLQKQPVEARTRKTITEKVQLRRELEITASRGYAVDDEERAVGVICIGAAIRDVSGSVAGAISISGPKSRITSQKLESYGLLVRARAQEASQRLGYVKSGAR
jgi:IclR family transcriptional regulator, KDG regulon repressor